MDDSDSGAITAPMFGKIVQVMASPGDVVEKDTPLVILEAMKMEHTLGAPEDGVVAEVNVEAGDQVDDGAVLVSFEEKE